MILLKKELIHNITLSILVICMAWALKHHYSIAQAGNLKWILAPTTAVVEAITRSPFDFESDIGYINQDLRIIIAPACAGVNFLIAAFGMSFFCGIFKLSELQKKCFWLITCAVGAYVATINVNAIRIWISIATITADIHGGWFTPQRVHRISGILIYFFFLSGFYHIIQKIIYHLQARDIKTAHSQKTLKKSAGPFHIGILPLACYWIIAIAVPWLNAAHKKDPAGFAEHSLTVVLLSSAVFGIFFIARAIFFKTRIIKVKNST